MIVCLHSPVGTHELIEALTADPAIMTVPSTWTKPTAVAAGGAWSLTGWQDNLAATLANRQPVTALTIRAARDDRAIAGPVWSSIAAALVHACQWTTTDWIAVRARADALTIVAHTSRRPSPSTIRRAADIIHHDHGLIPPADPRRTVHAATAPRAAPVPPTPQPPGRRSMRR